MFHPHYIAIKEQLSECGAKLVARYRQNAIIHATPALYIHLAGFVPERVGVATQGRLQINIHIVSALVAGQDGDIPDATAQAHDTIDDKVFDALSGFAVPQMFNELELTNWQDIEEPNMIHTVCTFAATAAHIANDLTPTVENSDFYVSVSR